MKKGNSFKIRKLNEFINQKAFTLIEIIVVLLILSMLVAIILLQYFEIELKAREKTAKGMVAELQARANIEFAKYCLSKENIELSEIERIGDYEFNRSTEILTDSDGNKFKIKYTPPIIDPLPDEVFSPALYEYIEYLGR
ncbi:hypothetical protein GMMP15_80066 [Candidatus Magnetomoraceae bacterium gMMP-15]